MDNGAWKMPEFSQITDIARADNLSRLLFLALLRDVGLEIWCVRPLHKRSSYFEGTVVSVCSRL